MGIMKSLNLIISLAYLSFCSSINLFGQATVTVPASGTGEIFAEVIPVFSAKKTSPINFGKFYPGPQGGKIILSPENTLSVQGGIYKSADSHNAASFYIYGDIDAIYSVSLPGKPVVITNISNSKTMFVENWISISEKEIGAGLLQNGFQTVYVGATLKIGSIFDNPVGIYTGTYTVTFDLN